MRDGPLGRSNAMARGVSRRNGTPAHERIDAQSWRDALAHPERTTDWSEFFREELRQAPWRNVYFSDGWTGWQRGFAGRQPTA